MFDLSKTFEKENFHITIITKDGEPLFFPQEIGEQLGYTDLANSVRTTDSFIEGEDYICIQGKELKNFKEVLQSPNLCRGNTTPQISPMTRSLIMLTESGFWGTCFKSTKPECIKLRLWVTSEVLPSIRKTGSYAVSPKDLYKESFESAIGIAKLCGLEGNQAILAANKAMVKFYGQDLLGAFQIELKTPTQERYLNTTEIGRLLAEPLSAVTLNRKLEELNLQKSSRDKKGKLCYSLTEEGRSYGIYLDTGKLHSNGTPVQQVKWKESLVGFLNNM
jgi:prophage antirepressor-like protein